MLGLRVDQWWVSTMLSVHTGSTCIWFWALYSRGGNLSLMVAEEISFQGGNLPFFNLIYAIKTFAYWWKFCFKSLGFFFLFRQKHPHFFHWMLMVESSDVTLSLKLFLLGEWSMNILNMLTSIKVVIILMKLLSRVSTVSLASVKWYQL